MEKDFILVMHETLELKSHQILYWHFDTSTYPSESWLSSSIDIMSSENTEGVWGNTYYKVDKYFPKFLERVLMVQSP